LIDVICDVMDCSAEQAIPKQATAKEIRISDNSKSKQAINHRTAKQAVSISTK
jgi:hypothetical protein